MVIKSFVDIDHSYLFGNSKISCFKETDVKFSHVQHLDDEFWTAGVKKDTKFIDIWVNNRHFHIRFHTFHPYTIDVSNKNGYVYLTNSLISFDKIRSHHEELTIANRLLEILPLSFPVVLIDIIVRFFCWIP